MYRYIGIERERVYFEIIDAAQKRYTNNIKYEYPIRYTINIKYKYSIRYANNIKHKYHTKHTIRAKRHKNFIKPHTFERRTK